MSLRKITLAFFFAAISLTCAAQESLKVKTFTLDNGLTVWINEDPNQTAVYGAVVVKAGAVDCPGTGIAHYFEHMMFKGTDKIGTIDYAAEKPYLDSIAMKYDELALAQSDEDREAIQKEINRLSVRAADFAIPNEYDNLIAESGGSGLNAFTSYDETVYHNKFLPEYFAQWAELNSERVMNPVFRLFQSELETVYEEKNRSNDNTTSHFQNQLLSNLFEGTGYSEEVLGTTENLKNPRLSQMREFFEKYYVASNMGLILTGNIKADEALPIIKKTFGRIRKGEAFERPAQVAQPIVGHKDVEAMVNIPLVRLGALCFRGPASNDPDYLAVNFMSSMLNNDSSTGLLDKLMVDHKLMVAMMTDFSFKHTGGLMVLYMPKLLFQRESKAVEHVKGALNTIKSGDFSDEFFESCKLSYKKQMLREYENLQNRIYSMAFAMSYEQDWNELLRRSDMIDAMTKEDIVAIANKYLTDDCIQVHKKKGTAPSDNLKKPDYEKVVPKNKENASAYAVKMRSELAKIKCAPKAVDFENDVQRVKVNPMVEVFASENPYNDVFDMTISYGIGTNERPELERVAAYVNLLGTADKSFDEIHDQLQAIGGSVAFTTGENNFDVIISGFDSDFEETINIVSELMNGMVGDSKKLRACKTEEKSGLLINRGDMEELISALRYYTCFGKRSKYAVDKGEYTDKALMDAFAQVQKVGCQIAYSGTHSAEEVAAAFDKAFDASKINVASNAPVDLEIETYDSPKIFFVDKKDANQTQFFAFVFSDPIETQYDRYFSNLYGGYLGGGMQSLLFQEIREFRSMAYSTYGRYMRPSFANTTKVPSYLISFVGTQCDKTIDAMDIVDSLVTKTPFDAVRIDLATKNMLSDRCNSTPDFRALPQYVALNIRDGYVDDPVNDFSKVIEDASEETLKAFWSKNIEGRPVVWCLVGNQKKVDMEALTKFGPVTMVKPSEIIKCRI